MAVTKSNKSNITSPNGNSLALFVDINDDKLKMKDINGEVQPLDDFVSVSGGTLQIEGGALINSTLQNVTDAENNVSQLQLATNATKINGNLEVASDLDVGGNTNIDGNTLILGTLEVDNTTKIKTANETYLDIEDGGGNNRFTIGKATGSQKVTLDYASNPTSSTEIVGSIRTYQNGTILSDIATFRRDGQVTFVERVNVEADSLVTTQTSSVIASTTTNANMVIAPNGTGALVASIPDGTTTGGNARGIYSIDLQRVRTNANQVARGDYNTVLNGNNNIGFGNYAQVLNGNTNQTGFSNYPTVINGSNNTATGNYSVVMGESSTGGSYGITQGRGCSNTGSYNLLLSEQGSVSGSNSAVFGYQNDSSSNYTIVSGYRARAYLFGQNVHGYQPQYFGGPFGVGTAQSSILIATAQNILTTGANTNLTLDGNSIIPLGNNRMWNVQIDTIAVVTTITGTATGVSVGDAYRETKQLLFKRVGGTSSIVGSVDTTAIKSDASLATCALTITAGASQEMALTFTGATFAGGGSVTMRIVSKVMLVEVAY